MHEDNETTPPCERGMYDDIQRDPKWPDWIDHTKCPECRVTLLPQNRCAWDMYWAARSPVANILAELEPRDMDPIESSDVAWRIHELTRIILDIESEDMEKANADAKRAASKTKAR